MWIFNNVQILGTMYRFWNYVQSTHSYVFSNRNILEPATRSTTPNTRFQSDSSETTAHTDHHDITKCYQIFVQAGWEKLHDRILNIVANSVHSCDKLCTTAACRDSEVAVRISTVNMFFFCHDSSDHDLMHKS